MRRFPVDIKYAEDLCVSSLGLPPTILKLAKDIIKETKPIKGWKKAQDVAVSPQLGKLQHGLALSLIRQLGKLGSGILVFVSGIADIVELAEKLDGLSRYNVCCIHSDIPFEEQESAFEPAQPNKVKVVLATNSAESSITLPDVDVVLCLGTHKALQYDSAAHHVALVNTWISKASGTQRAGRYHNKYVCLCAVCLCVFGLVRGITSCCVCLCLELAVFDLVQCIACTAKSCMMYSTNMKTLRSAENHCKMLFSI